jgi:hypothetical protein
VTLGHRAGAKPPEQQQEDALVDSDLAESIFALRDIFADRGISAHFGRASPELVGDLKTKLKLPRRYREFLMEADPIDVETRTPAERIRLIPSAQLTQEQHGFAMQESGQLIESTSPSGWRPNWVIIGHSSLLGDPYFLDVSSPDAEGDCPVYTAMSGTDAWKPRLCASSFALFVRILAIGMEVAKGFSEDDIDMDDEDVFREAVASQIRQYDPAALKAGHWT